MQVAQRHIHANRLNGVDNEWLTPAQAKAFCPPLNIETCATRSLGAALQRRGGTARHDAVAWGYARGADALGVDIIQNCEVTGIRREGDRVVGVETGKGFIKAGKVAVVAAGHTSVVMALAGLRMPLESTVLQALVSEPVKPVFPCVVMSNTIHAYISQSDKGELVIGAGSDQYNSYSQRGSFQIVEHTLEAICELFPQFSRMRMLRHWGGIVDVTTDRSPIVGKTPLQGSTSIAAGAPAASRRRRARATCSPGPWPRTSRTPSTRRSGSTASAPAGWSTRPPPPPWPTEDLAHAARTLSHLRAAPGDRVPLRRRGAYPAAGPRGRQRSGMGRISLLPHEPEGRRTRALVPPAWLRPLVQRPA